MTDKPIEFISDNSPSREERLLAQHAPDLKAKGYLSTEGVPIGAGIHLIPLLMETFKATKRIFDHSLELIRLEPGEEPTADPNEIIKAFYLAISDTTQALQKDGFENPADLAFELILPHMDWIFCIHYAYWSAQTNPFDVLYVNPEAFSEDNPNNVKDTLNALLQHARAKEAKWTIKVTEKALSHL